MTWWQTVIGVLLFACISAVLYVWGLKKSVRQQDDLTRILICKASVRVVKYLQRNGAISMAEMERQVANVRAGRLWSKQRAVVQNPKIFARQVRDHLLSQQRMEWNKKDGQYHLTQ